MNEVRRGAEVAGQVRIFVNCLERGWGPTIAVFADQRVNGFVLAKLSHSGRENDQLSAVGEGHAGTIYGLVAQPGAVKLVRVEIHHGFANGLFEYLEIHLKAEFRGAAEALDVIANKEASDGQTSIRGTADHRQH